MTAENTVEHEAVPAFSVRLSEEIEKIIQQRISVMKEGNFPEFMATSLQKLDGESPEVARVARDAIDKQTTPRDREDMFWYAWRIATVAKVIKEEFGKPAQLSSTR